MRGRSVRLLVVVAAGMVVLLSVDAALAIASVSGASVSGEISRAEANEAWTTGSIAGSAEWTDCSEGPEEPGFEPFSEGEGEIIWDPGPPSCSWTPYATLGPGSSPTDCSGRRLDQPLPSGVSVVWEGETRTAAGSESFDVPEVPLNGASNQLLCLSLLETVDEPAICIEGEMATPQAAGYEAEVGEFECPEYLPVPYHHTLDARFLAAVGHPADPAPAESDPPAPPPSTPDDTGFESVPVRWGIRSVGGPRSLTLSWTATYCLDSVAPTLGDIATRWQHRGHRRFRARITVHLNYPARQAQRIQGGGCQEIGQVPMSRRITLRHPLTNAVLLDGGISPPQRRWPG